MVSGRQAGWLPVRSMVCAGSRNRVGDAGFLMVERMRLRRGLKFVRNLV